MDIKFVQGLQIMKVEVYLIFQCGMQIYIYDILDLDRAVEVLGPEGQDQSSDTYM